jgi:hypothetical protein
MAAPGDRVALVADQIKHGEAVVVTGNCLAVDHARTDGQGSDRCGDKGKAESGRRSYSPHASRVARVAAAMRDDPKAIVLDFVNPAWPGRRFLC